MKSGTLSKLLDEVNVSRDSSRSYIGASSIGSACWRQIWYEHNGYPSDAPPPRMQRILETGKALEKMIIWCLKDAGIELIDDVPEFRDFQLDYFIGHPDGLTKTYIIEIKTVKHSLFGQLKKKGLYSVMPEYYAQVQAYMGMSGYKMAIVLAMDKDDCEFFDEVVFFDSNYYETLKAKAEAIHESSQTPPRAYHSPVWYKCKLCKFKRTCWDEFKGA